MSLYKHPYVESAHFPGEKITWDEQGAPTFTLQLTLSQPAGGGVGGGRDYMLHSGHPHLLVHHQGQGQSYPNNSSQSHTSHNNSK